MGPLQNIARIARRCPENITSIVKFVKGTAYTVRPWIVQGGGQLPGYRGVGQGRASGKPGQAPGCLLPDMLVVAAKGLVDVEQEDKVVGLLQMGL